MKVYLRKATTDDLSDMLKLVEEAKENLAHRGIPQWQNGIGPNREIIQKDIDHQQAYVLIVDNQVAGMAIITTDIDLSYEAIKEQWSQKFSKYCSIHRLIIGSTYQGKGLAVLLLQLLTSHCQMMDYHDVRIDTHPQNKMMQKAIKKAGFIKRGVISLPIPTGERNAYQFLNDK